MGRESERLTWAEAVADNRRRGRLIVAEPGGGYVTVRVPWAHECPPHGVARDVCRCGFHDGEPIGNNPSNGLTERDRAWHEFEVYRGEDGPHA